MFSKNSLATFDHNVGTNGGGIALLGNPFLILYYNANLKFISNQAHSKGGAIYYVSNSERDSLAPKNFSCSIMTIVQSSLTGLLVYSLSVTMTCKIIRYSLPDYYLVYGGTFLAVVMLISPLLTRCLLERFITMMTHILRLLIIL